jgi:hypothetical protein
MNFSTIGTAYGREHAILATLIFSARWIRFVRIGAECACSAERLNCRGVADADLQPPTRTSALTPVKTFLPGVLTQPPPDTAG